jgi:ribosomal protein S18 acetylase RimI-like enzyme
VCIEFDKRQERPRLERVKMTDIRQFRDLIIGGITEVPGNTEYKQEEIDLRTEAYYQNLIEDPNNILLTAKNSAGNVIGGFEAKIRTIIPDMVFMSHLAQQSRGAHDSLIGKRIGYGYWLVVSPEMRSRGIASDLYQQYESLLRQKGDVSLLIRYVDVDNRESLTFNEKIGTTNILAVDYGRDYTASHAEKDKRIVGWWFYKNLQ